MLVYILEDKYEDLLKPLTEDDIPNWILEKEYELNKKIESKNFLQVLFLF
jgi:hypothetical protein